MFNSLCTRYVGERVYKQPEVPKDTSNDNSSLQTNKTDLDGDKDSSDNVKKSANDEIQKSTSIKSDESTNTKENSNEDSKDTETSIKDHAKDLKETGNIVSNHETENNEVKDIKNEEPENKSVTEKEPTGNDVTKKEESSNNEGEESTESKISIHA